MAVVSTSFSVEHGVRTVVTADDAEVEHSVRQVVSKSVSLVHGVRRTMSPGKVVAIQHAVRERVSKSQSIEHAVRVPISSTKSVSVVYGVRSKVSTDSSDGGAFSPAFSPAFNSQPSPGIVIEYDTGITGNTQVSKSVSIVYHTLITPTVDEVITTPIEVDEVPPQTITTTSF